MPKFEAQQTTACQEECRHYAPDDTYRDTYRRASPLPQSCCGQTEVAGAQALVRKIPLALYQFLMPPEMV